MLEVSQLAEKNDLEHRWAHMLNRSAELRVVCERMLSQLAACVKLHGADESRSEEQGMQM